MARWKIAPSKRDSSDRRWRLIKREGLTGKKGPDERWRLTTRNILTIRNDQTEDRGYQKRKVGRKVSRLSM